MISEIINSFEQKFNKFAEKTDAFTSRFICDEDSAIGTLYFTGFNVEFEYSLECGCLIEKSGLNIILDFSKRTDKPLKCMMYDIIELIDKNNFNCWFYCYIENKSRMELCFDKLSSDFLQILPELKKLACTAEGIIQIESVLKHNTQTVLGIDFEKELSEFEDDIIDDTYDYLYRTYFGYQQSCFATDEYLNFLLGNFKKSLKRYEKKKKRLIYEDNIIRYIKDCEESQPIISHEYESLKDGLKAYTSSNGFLPVFVSWCILLIPCTLFFTVLYLIISLALYNSELYSTQLEPYNFPAVILPAFICSIAASYFLQSNIRKKFFKKSYEKQKDYNAIFNSTKTKKRMGIFFYLIYILSLVATFLFANMGVSLSETDIRVNDNFLSIHGHHYTYNEIETVDYTDEMYTISFNDGYTFKLYEFAEDSDIEEKILPIFEVNGVTI